VSSLLGRLVGTAATVATAPVTLTMACATTAATVAKEIFGGTPPRRRWQSDGRCWIEIRGLDGEYGSALADTLVETVRAQPGVSWARVNHAVSRLIVAVEATGPSIDELCQIVADVEADVPGDGKRLRPTDLPGDGVVLAGRALSTAANGLGLCAATAGRLMMWPSLPTGLTGVVTAIDYQPRLRAFVEQRLGDTAADTVLGLAAASVYTVTQSPSSLAVEFFRHLSQVGELLASARTWDLHEPALAEQAAADHLETPERPCPMPPGPVERHAARSGVIQGVAGPVVGLLTGNLNTAGTAAVVAAPKAARNARESFAATLGRGLADRHDVLTLRPDGLRRLDRIDVVVVDPRVLLTEELRVSQLRDVPDQARGELWQWAGDEVRRGALHAGWHRRGRARGQVLVRHAHHGLAAAVLGEIRRADAEVVSVASDELDELRSSFDELYPVDGSVDAALLEAVQALQADGHTVAVVSSAAPQALSAADLSIGVLNRTAPWRADLLAPDLAAVWRIMHALSAAQKASRRGVELATSASMLAALLMVPGVRGVGPGPVTAGAGAGLLVGMQLARGVLGAPAPQPAPVQDWHAMSVEQTRQALPAPDREPARARSRLAAPVGLATRIVGPTLGLAGEMAGAVRTELSDPLTPVLAVGAAASALLGSPVDAVLVGSVLTGNAVLAAGQQVRAERLLRRLLAVQDPPARLVVDDGDDSVEAAQLRAGDLIEVRPGEVIPADCRIVDADDVEIDESALTGESLPVFKQVEATPGAIVAERSCMLYAGTTVVSGIARAVVTAVGAQTQVRRAAEAAPTHGSTVGLQTQLRDLTNRALPFSLAGGALVSGLGVLRLTPLRQAVASGVAVAVAAVPEGLPLVATLAQQASARRLTRSGALVRTPKAVEALGRVDVVCFDKTGTLSENRLRVSHVEAAGGTEKQVLDIAARATQPRNGDNHEHATDAAVIEAANTESPRAVDVEAHLPFRSGRPYSATLSGSELFIKGAPEVVLAASGNPARSVEKAVHRMAESGLRVIAVAHRRVTAEEVAAARADDAAFAELCSHGLEMAGLLGLSDTPRAESAGLLAALQDQGIGVRLITGDHPVTATAIAIELGLPVSAAQVISGSEWEAMSRRSQEKAVQDRVVFARMTPEHKVQVVQTLERTGLVCAMVGDGANDAAAIRAATVGIGVASRGSDPARTAADVMLLDGRIGALLDALEEGRQLWRRVQAAVSVLLGGNAGEVAFAIVGSALTGRSPLNARQLLLVNMMTDALPAAALAVSPSIGNGDHAVRGPDRSALWRTVAIRGTTTAAAATTAWLLAGFTLQPRRASTVALVALVSTQLGQTLIDSHSPLVVSTAAGSLATLGVLISTPGVSQLLGCTPLGPLGWAQALGTAGVATTAALVAPRVLSRVQSSMSTTPSRHSAAYSSRNGTAMKRATTDTGSDEPLASDEDTPSTVLTAGV
jgi:H+-transporting ATPase